MAGSTAGWCPSDRDRFPPRFLLPPSLQTHNCIISTHLASSPPPSPFDIPRVALSLSFSPTLPPSPLPLSLAPPPLLSLSLCLSSLSVDSPLTSFSRSDPMRAFALAPLSSSLVHSTDQPVDRFSLFIVIYPVSPLVFRTKELPHARNGPPPPSFFAASLRDANAMLFLSLAPFCHSCSTASVSFFLSHLAKQRSCRVFASSFFFFPFLDPLAAPPPPVVSFSSFSLYLVVRSVIEPAIRVDMQLFIPHDVGSPQTRIGRTKSLR